MLPLLDKYKAASPVALVFSGCLHEGLGTLRLGRAGMLLSSEAFVAMFIFSGGNRRGRTLFECM